MWTVYLLAIAGALVCCLGLGFLLVNLTIKCRQRVQALRWRHLYESESERAIRLRSSEKRLPRRLYGGLPTSNKASEAEEAAVERARRLLE